MDPFTSLQLAMAAVIHNRVISGKTSIILLLMALAPFIPRLLSLISRPRQAVAGGGSAELVVGHPTVGQNDLPFAALSTAEAAPGCPDAPMRTGAVNLGWHDKYLVMKQKYAGFQIASSDSCHDVAICVNFKSFLTNGTLGDYTSDLAMFCANLEHVTGMSYSAVIDFATEQWNQLAPAQKHCGQREQPTSVPLNKVKIWLLDQNKEDMMARHAVVEKMDEETTTAAAKFYDFAMGIYNGTAVNTTPSPAMVLYSNLYHAANAFCEAAVAVNSAMAHDPELISIVTAVNATTVHLPTLVCKASNVLNRLNALTMLVPYTTLLTTASDMLNSKQLQTDQAMQVNNQSVESTFQQLNNESYQQDINTQVQTMPSLQVMPSENSLGSLMDLLIGNDTVPSQFQDMPSIRRDMLSSSWSPRDFLVTSPYTTTMQDIQDIQDIQDMQLPSAAVATFPAIAAKRAPYVIQPTSVANATIMRQREFMMASPFGAMAKVMRVSSSSIIISPRE